ncbi:MAG: uroporphyrinogen-III C-methyltransferase [Helicobacteraceae bacterium]|nr:uroporphyrinogen-III C-methyltransferase [Candidatus Sulfurimonas ponti]MBL6973105.1 uroporphyrinogen-III C-methyltransferase [Sulfurimonas sp.]
MENKTLPILLKNQKILLIGGGNVALQKADVLLQNKIDFKVVGSVLDYRIKTISPNVEQKDFELSDIQDYKIIIDATGNMEVTNVLLEYKKTHDILLNVVDVPQYCDFYFMALTKNRPLQIAVSSNGASPTAAKYFRDECEAMIPKDITAYLEAKQKERDNGIIEVEKTQQELMQKKAKIYLVGCGTGDVELLTLKAYKIIKSVDIVFIDHLIADEILEIIPETTKKVFVGKQKGFHSVKQAQINKLLIEEAANGSSIARLKSGDPYIFGRGSEEAISLVKEGIDIEVVPGISSAIAGPLLAGIAPTARGYATNLSIVSAHLAGNRVNLEWVPMLKMDNHTVVVLMGVSRAGEIAACAKSIGVDMKMPVAVISNASRKNQSTQIGTLKNMHTLCENAPRPALIVIGNVVNLHEILPKMD